MSIFMFIYGTIIGSFLNVCINRIPKGKSILYPASHCENCKNKIKIKDNIPIVGYIKLGGKCRHCNVKIPIQYLLIEFFTGSMFLLLYFKYELSFEFIKYCIFICFLIIVAIIDFKTKYVYFNTILTIIFLRIGLFFMEGDKINFIFYNYFLAGFMPALIICIIILLTNGMGWGDVEVIFISGVFLGLKHCFLLLFLSFFIGAIISIILMITKVKSRKDAIAFVPYIAISSIICVFYGENIIFNIFRII
ncbi:prepilin peptidase [Clostridium cochlearium]|uniref:Type IV prepilin leader peptidase pilD n=1 Tax=Clostridium cochlearium TaxID=1494 RepID=A0A240AWQ4_CLOCO|nr:A24 family peptidase [Clostridium cochlearium]NMB10135.1 prepilin peptidase [Tissierellia bacterium]MBU5268597.1 prepilin peptidase [Clostridium cochlearium]MDU1442684.1 prepilin peptidase [Clostridium cochlearium]SNV87821.1 type IV prepilin leader peptidase pilD [Clostridium cochlearium]SQB34556.1 type IV prepilin leader peptidase pilD [Clostridium cochlearium]